MAGGPLAGLRVVELAGVGPGPFCAMLLADLGADVLRIDRPGPAELGLDIPRELDLPLRGRRSVAIDLKSPAGAAAARRLIGRADALIEGFRPGVAERLGLGPDACLALNPRLVYGRMTGWGQDGPLATAAGHDINYLALAGALGAIGPSGGPPVPPLNLVADLGGGALYLAFGLLAALHERTVSGRGQVVDAAMVDGAASLMTSTFGLAAAGRWRDTRGSNDLDGGAPWYSAYETADGRFVAVGAIEGRFYAELLRRLGLDPASLPAQHDRSGWPLLRHRLAEAFLTRTRDEWTRVMEGSDACVAPVLSLTEAASHPHNVARGTFVEVDGVVQPGPAPRFSRTPARIAGGPEPVGHRAEETLGEWGWSEAEIEALRRT
jgi:alpha-methylacyl-CoA racemase